VAVDARRLEDVLECGLDFGDEGTDRLEALQTLISHTSIDGFEQLLGDGGRRQHLVPIRLLQELVRLVGQLLGSELVGEAPADEARQLGHPLD